MGIEIERRFLFDPGQAPRVERSVRLRQAYLSLTPEVRIRTSGLASSITVKSGSGIVREEYEYKIPEVDAVTLMELSPWLILEKVRGFTEFKGLEWVLDSYMGDNEGLFVAEVELGDPEQYVALPPWIVEEVTNDDRYLSSSLAQTPFRLW